MSHTEGPLGSSVRDAAQRAADIIDVLVPRPGSRDEAARLAMPQSPEERQSPDERQRRAAQVLP